MHQEQVGVQDFAQNTEPENCRLDGPTFWDDLLDVLSQSHIHLHKSSSATLPDMNFIETFYILTTYPAELGCCLVSSHHKVNHTHSRQLL